MEILGDLPSELSQFEKPELLAPTGVLTEHLTKLGVEPGGYDHQTDAQMTQILDELLELAIKDYEPDIEQVDIPIGKDLKWRYSSAYQKAVRRNDPSVQLAGFAIEMCDSQYMWRRAPTIALEDVAMGDPWVCALVLHACRFVKTRRRYGPQRLLAFLGTIMGRAVKDRLSCDSYCLPAYHPKMRQVNKTVQNMSIHELAEIYLSGNAPFGWRMAAGWALAGPRWAYEGVFPTCRSGHGDILFEAQQGMATPVVEWVSRQYAKVGRDAMFVAYPLVWQKLAETGRAGIEIAEGFKVERSMIDHVLSATFDSHTQDGKRAISYFAKSCPDVKAFFAKYDKLDVRRCLGLATFTVDSSLLDRYVSCPWAYRLYEETLTGEAMGADIRPDLLAELCGIIHANREALDYARKRVLS